MAAQTRLLDPESPNPGARRTGFHLDARSREAGRRGLAKARAALAETTARTAAARRVTDDLDSHATAA